MSSLRPIHPFVFLALARVLPLLGQGITRKEVPGSKFKVQSETKE